MRPKIQSSIHEISRVESVTSAGRCALIAERPAKTSTANVCIGGVTMRRRSGVENDVPQSLYMFSTVLGVAFDRFALTIAQGVEFHGG